MRGYLYGYLLLAAAALAGMAVIALVGFFCIRFGESGARQLLDGCTASAERGLIVRDSSGIPLWITTPRDTVRKRYVAPKPKG